jgi:hypothetical protein
MIRPEMRPGKELDALVAETFGLPLADYSTDISAALAVVEKICATNKWPRFNLYYGVGDDGPPWCCRDYPEPGWSATFQFWRPNEEGEEELHYITEIEDSAPHAICLAALRTKGIIVESRYSPVS